MHICTWRRGSVSPLVNCWCWCYWVYVLLISCATGEELCLNGWKRQKNPIPISIRPSINCFYGNHGQTGQLTVTWDTGVQLPPGFQLKAKLTDPDTNVNEQDTNTVVLSWDKHSPFHNDPATAIPFQLFATQNTSQGETILPIEMSFIKGSISFPSNTDYALTLTPFIISDYPPVVRYRFQWTPEEADNGKDVSPGNVILVYNRTHTLQKTVSSRSVCLNDLRPAGRYEFCVQAVSNICHGPWTCISRILAMSDGTAAVVAKKQAHVRNLELIGFGHDWFQLAWLPPQYSLMDVQYRHPRAYVIVVKPTSNIPSICGDRIYHLKSPWSGTSDDLALQTALGWARRELMSANCSSDTHSVVLKPLGSWPDWGQPEELLDEFGPVGEFTVTVDNVLPNITYEVKVVTVVTGRQGGEHPFISITVPIGNPYCQLGVSHPSGKWISWSISRSFSETAALSKNIQARLSVYLIGRPTRTPLVQSCNTTVRLSYFTRLQGSAQRLYLFTIELPPTPLESLQLPTDCLTSCHTYELVVQLRHVGKQQFQCARRIIPSHPNGHNMEHILDDVVTVEALAHNYLFVHFKRGTGYPGRLQCPPVGYVLTANSADGWQSDPVLVTADVLESGRLPPVIHSGVNGAVTGYAVLLSNPNPAADSLQLRIAIVNTTGVISSLTKTVKMKLYSECYLDCVWPTTPPFAWNNSVPDVPYHSDLYGNAIISDPSARQPVSCLNFANRQTSWGIQPIKCSRSPTLGRYASHMFCQFNNFNLATCLVPRCDQMAPLSCIVSARLSSVNSSSAELQWHSGGEFDFFKHKDQLKSAGFLAMLHSIDNRTGSSTCVRASLLDKDVGGRSSRLQVQQKPAIRSLLWSCPKEHLRTASISQPPIRESFQGLNQSSKYLVSITAYTARGQLGGTWKTYLHTKLARPCTAEDVNFPEIQPTALKLRWTPGPAAKCGAATHVILEYCDVDYGVSSCADTPLSLIMRLNFPLSQSAPHETRLASISSCRKYCFVLFLRNNVGVSGASSSVCQNTKSAPLVTTPRLQHNLSVPKAVSFGSKPAMTLGPGSNTSTFCKVNVSIDYPKTCPVEYEAQMRIMYTKDLSSTYSHRNSFTINRTVEPGLVYEIRARVRKPTSEVTNGPVASVWSTWVPAYSGPIDVEIVEVRADIRHPTKYVSSRKQAIYQCDQPDPAVHMWKPKAPLDSSAICLELDWKVVGGTRGIIGYLVQVYREETQSPLTALADTNNQTKKRLNVGDDRKYGDQTKSVYCLRVIWLPCSNCLGYYGLSNAHHVIYPTLEARLKACNRYGDKIAGRASVMQKLSKMGSEFVHPEKLTVSDDRIRLVFSWSYNTTTSTKAKRSYATKSPGWHQASPIEGGYVEIYAVMSTEVRLMHRRDWQLHVSAQPDSPANWVTYSSTVGALFLILLAMLAILVVFLRRKHNESVLKSVLESVKYQETGYFGEDGDMVYEGPCLPSRKLKSLNAPDAIHMNEFVVWVDRHSINNYAFFRREFFALRIQAQCQQRAKHLTHEVGRRPENMLRNKYRNLLAFDHNYVRLLKSRPLRDTTDEFLVQKANQADKSPTKADLTLNVLSDKKGKDNVGSFVGDPDRDECQWIPSDYINASRITGRGPNIPYCLVDTGVTDLSNRLPRAYIAAQAPETHTRGLFWQMIWEQNVQLIVMLTRLRENDKEKCAPYWPEGEGETAVLESERSILTVRYDSFQISLSDVIAEPVYLKRNLTVTNLVDASSRPRTVIQLHMLRWADFSAPSMDDFTTLLYAYWMERRFCSDIDSPVLVHCSAGVGRTGTFICLDQLCNQVRYYLQPNFEPNEFLTPSSLDRLLLEEPIYANLKAADSKDDAVHPLEPSVRSVSLSDLDDDSANDTARSLHAIENENQLNSRQILLRGSEGQRNSAVIGQYANRVGGSIPQKRNLGVGLRKFHTIDVYNMILWLRANRSYMVQTEDQYIFIFRYLSHFIQTLNEYETIYQNI